MKLQKHGRHIIAADEAFETVPLYKLHGRSNRRTQQSTTLPLTLGFERVSGLWSRKITRALAFGWL